MKKTKKEDEKFILAQKKSFMLKEKLFSFINRRLGTEE